MKRSASVGVLNRILSNWGRWASIVLLTVFGLGGSFPRLLDAKSVQEPIDDRIVRPVATKSIPEVLEPWKEWVLYGHSTLDCPVAMGSGNNRYCIWPSRLEMNVAGSKAVFRQEWTVYTRSWVDLPGSDEYWPVGVTVDGKNVPVTLQNGRPSVLLQPGDYVIAGEIVWGSRPKSLRIPAHTGLISLTVDGESRKQVNISSDGNLLFGASEQKTSPDKGVDSVEVQVFRELIDDIPMKFETVLRLTVSGRDRELRLGRFLPEGAIPYSFHSELPARIEPDGSLRVQARAGIWGVRLVSRYPRNPQRLTMKKMSEDWPDREFWAFQANQKLRVVSLSGASTIDPHQTQIPDEWKTLPVYLVTPSTQLVITEERRPEGSVTTEQLALKRTFWLDFDGSGYTIRDNLTGTAGSFGRLNMYPEYDLGRVSLNRDPQLVTRLEGDERPGLEVRSGNISIEAVSRYEADITKVPATGWDHDLNSLQVELNLPPGWKLIYARGADYAKGSWIERWNLWNIFLVLIIAVSIGRVVHPVWGGCALVALTIIYHSPKAPVSIWLVAAVTLALLKVLPPSPVRSFVRFIHHLVIIGLILIVVSFNIEQLRSAIYPQLAQREHYASGRSYSSLGSSPSYQETTIGEGQAAISAAIYGDLSGQYSTPYKTSRKRSLPFDPNTKIQTGPGVPEWRWSQVSIGWNGPVTADQELNLAFITPALFRLLACLRVFLVTALTAMFVLYTMGGGGRWSRLQKFWLKDGLKFLLIGLTIFSGMKIFNSPAYAESSPANFPPQQILEELERRLTQPPPGLPNPGSITNGLLSVKNDRVIFRMRIDAVTFCAVELPAARDQWLPRSVVVDGKFVPLRLNEKGQLLAALSPGTHEVVLEGVATGTEMRFPLSVPAHNIRVDVDDWLVSGLTAGRVPGKSLHLRREEEIVQEQKNVLLPDPIPPFVTVERRLILGKEWQVHTVVRRQAPARGAVNLEIPLLQGERLLTAGVEQDDGRVAVALQQGVDNFSWVSSLPITDRIDLRAPEDMNSWVEQWVLDVSTLWHFEYEGPSHQKSAPRSQLQWIPRPGDTLLITISRPIAVEGQTRTIEQVRLESKPGKRTTENKLSLRIRSSLGGDYAFQLPEGSKIKKVWLDRVNQVISKRPGEVKVSLHPGVQTLEVEWESREGIGLRTTLPVLDLGQPLSNITQKISLPVSRWVLLVSGPPLGPAVLYWSVLAGIVLVALGLSRYKKIPLKVHDWFLLLIGLSTINGIGGILIVLWFFLIVIRMNEGRNLSPVLFNLLQCFIVFFTLVAVIALLATIPMSLLSRPDMHIAGYNSHGYDLEWYLDRGGPLLPESSVVSLPLWVYRVTMLFWSLWMVFAMTRWIKWGWDCFSTGGLWKRRIKKIKSSETS